DLVVIMASTLTRRNAEVSLKALSLGAADYIPKPATNREVTTSATFRRELIEKVRQLGSRRRRAPLPPPAAAPADGRARTPFSVPKDPGVAPRAKFSVSEPGRAAPAAPTHGSDVKLRPFSNVAPRVLVIGSSTGGPQALTSLVARIAPVFDRAPVL